MEEIKTLKSYFNKLQRTIVHNADFKLFNVALVGKNKIDDILCCILATFPNTYKRLINLKEGRDFHSILSYNLLLNALKRKFIFNPNVYLVNVGTANKLLTAISKSVEADVNRIEKLYGKHE